MMVPHTHSAVNKSKTVNWNNQAACKANRSKSKNRESAIVMFPEEKSQYTLTEFRFKVREALKKVKNGEIVELTFHGQPVIRLLKIEKLDGWEKNKRKNKKREKVEGKIEEQKTEQQDQDQEQVQSSPLWDDI